MFKKNDPVTPSPQQPTRVNYEQVDTIVGTDMNFVGDITAGGSVRYEGNFKGTINISGNLIVGRNALISGNIKAQNVHVIGTVEGNIECEQLKLLSTAKLTGDVAVDSIIIDEGAIFIGKTTTKVEEVGDPSIQDILSTVE